MSGPTLTLTRWFPPTPAGRLHITCARAPVVPPTTLVGVHAMVPTAIVCSPGVGPKLVPTRVIVPPEGGSVAGAIPARLTSTQLKEKSAPGSGCDATVTVMSRPLPDPEDMKQVIRSWSTTVTEVQVTRRRGGAW